MRRGIENHAAHHAVAKRRSNYSFNPTASSIAFMRETCFNSASRRGGLIRALDGYLESIDMATIIGIIIGILATVIVGHYYFRRTINKNLTPYLLLGSRVFAGIDPSVREQLKFYFKESEVRDLFQLEFIIANDGERAIRDCLAPLSLILPEGVKVLDASVMYRNPSELELEIIAGEASTNRASLSFQFPLLNRGDFFLVKLLLSGRRFKL